MRDITEKLLEKDCIICMHCGAIYEGATIEDYWGNKCSNCGDGWFNWVGVDKSFTFWGTPAAHFLAAGKLNEYKEAIRCGA